MKKVALVIGHNPRGRGATSPYLEQTEYEYYRDITDIVNKLNDNIDIYILMLLISHHLTAVNV